MQTIGEKVIPVNIVGEERHFPRARLVAIDYKYGAMPSLVFFNETIEIKVDGSVVHSDMENFTVAFEPSGEMYDRLLPDGTVIGQTNHNMLAVELYSLFAAEYKKRFPEG